MTPLEFDDLARLTQLRTGVQLAASRLTTIEANLWEVRRRHGLPPVGELIRRARDCDRAIECELIEAILSHETQFFRDGKPFEDFAQLMLPGLAASRAPGETLRIWSAAASTGQEAYSLAMILHESAGVLAGRQPQVLASDVSSLMIARARQARYSSFEVQRGVSTKRLITHFTREGNDWILKPEIAGLVRFEKQNLIQDLSHLPIFDVIFCRNILQCFDEASRRALVRQLASRLRPDGYLVIGAGESLAGLSDELVQTAPGAASYGHVRSRTPLRAIA